MVSPRLRFLQLHGLLPSSHLDSLHCPFAQHGVYEVWLVNVLNFLLLRASYDYAQLLDPVVYLPAIIVPR